MENCKGGLHIRPRGVEDAAPYKPKGRTVGSADERPAAFPQEPNCLTREGRACPAPTVQSQLKQEQKPSIMSTTSKSKTMIEGPLAKQILLVSLAAGVLLLFVGLFGSPALLELLNTKEDLLPGAILYLRVYFLGMPAMMIYNFGSAILRAIGDTKRPLYFLAAAGVINIILNILLVVVFGLIPAFFFSLASAILLAVPFLIALISGSKLSHKNLAYLTSLNGP